MRKFISRKTDTRNSILVLKRRYHRITRLPQFSFEYKHTQFDMYTEHRRTPQFYLLFHEIFSEGKYVDNINLNFHYEAKINYS